MFNADMKRHFAQIGLVAMMALTLHWSGAFGLVMPMSGMGANVTVGMVPMECPMGFVCPLRDADFNSILANIATDSTLLALIVLPVILLALLTGFRKFRILPLAVVTNNGPPVLLTSMKRE